MRKGVDHTAVSATNGVTKNCKKNAHFNRIGLRKRRHVLKKLQDIPIT